MKPIQKAICTSKRDQNTKREDFKNDYLRHVIFFLHKSTNKNITVEYKGGLPAKRSNSLSRYSFFAVKMVSYNVGIK